MEGTETHGEQPSPKKLPRKPRPSEIAAKKAKAAKKKKVAKPKPKAKRPKPKKVKTVKRKVSKAKTSGAGPDRSERIDMRVTKTQKARVLARAKRLKRTVTSVVMEAIEKIK